MADQQAFTGAMKSRCLPYLLKNLLEAYSESDNHTPKG